MTPAQKRAVAAQEQRITTVVLDTTDALAVAQTMRTLARDRRTPHGVRELLSRVGDQIRSAAMLQLATPTLVAEPVEVAS